MPNRKPLSYLGIAQPTPPNQVVSDRSPTANDYQGFNIGDRWVVPTSLIAPSQQEWILMSKAQNQAVWVDVIAGNSPATYNDHELLVGTGTTTIHTIGNAAAGLPLLSQGVSADPSYGVLAVPAGGTANSSFAAFTPIIGGTTATGALQSVASLGVSGQVLTSNGAGVAPTFQAAGSGVLQVPGGGTGDTSFTAYAVVTGGITSVDPLQTVASLGTANQVLTSQGAGLLPIWANNEAGTGFTSIVSQVFTGSGTYTPTANMKYCIVKAVGGGGGAGSLFKSFGNTGCSGGGGAGGYASAVFSAATIGASQVVTIGGGGAGGLGSGVNDGVAGGNTTFGALVTCGGGSPSLSPPASGVPRVTSGGAGGTASGGSVNIAGQAGQDAALIAYGDGGSIGGVQSGNGGSGKYGQGGYFYIAQAVSVSPGGVHGLNGSGYGAGGGGASNSGFVGTAASLNGGSGSSGIVIVTEYV